MENQYLGLELVAGKGYVSPTGTNDLIIFMNIGVPGKTGHDFDNKSDPDIDFYRYNINFSLSRVKF